MRILKKLPGYILPVSIAGWAPKGWDGEEYKKVAPKNHGSGNIKRQEIKNFT